MNEYLDFVKNNVEPWQIGVALLAMAAGKWAWRVVRMLMSMRMLLVGAGTALMYPYVRPFAARVEQGDVNISDAVLLGAGAIVWLATLALPAKAKQTVTLSSGAQKVMAALDKVTMENSKHTPGGSHDRWVSGTLDVWSDGDVWIKELPCRKLINRSECKLISKRGREVYNSLMSESTRRDHQAALDSLNT